MAIVPEVEGQLPPSLRLLRKLVILLLLSMIAGVIAVVWLLVTRLPVLLDQTGPKIPTHLSLPAGETPAAVTLGRGWTLVVTASDRVLIFDAKGALIEEVAVALPKAP